MEVGQKVKVRRLRDRLSVSKQTIDTIKQNPVGTITGYKMVDGSGVGVVVKFDNRFSTWFFEDELESV